MSLYVIEGTWEEIERRKAELIGHQLRVTIKMDKPIMRKPLLVPKASPVSEPKILQGWGMLSGIVTTEEYLREKREDTLREDQSLG